MISDTHFRTKRILLRLSEKDEKMFLLVKISFDKEKESGYTCGYYNEYRIMNYINLNLGLLLLLGRP